MFSEQAGETSEQAGEMIRTRSQEGFSDKSTHQMDCSGELKGQGEQLKASPWFKQGGQGE